MTTCVASSNWSALGSSARSRKFTPGPTVLSGPKASKPRRQPNRFLNGSIGNSGSDPAPFVEYSPKIAPFNWRGWWNFGTGALGDMACHIMDMPYWGLELGAPLAISGKQQGGSEWSAPINSSLTYEFAPNQYSVAEGIKYFWYDGQIGAEFKADTLEPQTR